MFTPTASSAATLRCPNPSHAWFSNHLTSPCSGCSVLSTPATIPDLPTSVATCQELLSPEHRRPRGWVDADPAEKWQSRDFRYQYWIGGDARGTQRERPITVIP